MRVLLVNDAPPGAGTGAEVHLARLAAGLEAVGDDVALFAGRIRHEGLRRALDLWDPMARRALVREARSFRPDVVHYHNVIRELSVSVLGAVPGAASVMTVHDAQIVGVLDGSGTGPNRTRDPLRPIKLVKARVDRLVAARRIDSFIAVSSHMAERLRRAGLLHVTWVPAFAPAPAPHDRPPSASNDLMFAGRIVPEKGIHILVDAFERVVARRPEARLLIAGSGPDEDRLARRAAGLGAGRIRLLGRLEETEIAGLMGSVRAVVAPSIVMEAAGLIVVEAALAARPVVVTDDPGLRELVDASDCGIVVPREDTEALADAMLALLDDPARADAMGASGRERALAERTTEAAVAATRHVYEQAIASHRSTRNAPAATRR